MPSPSESAAGIGLADFQARIRDALVSGGLENVAHLVAAGRPEGNDLAPLDRLEIHGNNVTITLSDALAANFPVTARLVGSDFFAAAAKEFLRRHPPKARSLIDLGAGFPDFIASFRGADRLLYLGDVARLDWACHRAYHGAEAEPLAPASLASVAEDAWPGARFRLHPTLSLIRSDFPIDAIWRAHQGAAPADWTVDLDLGRAHVIIVRPRASVEVLSVPGGIFTLVGALANRATLDEACTMAAAADPAFNLQGALAACLANALFVAVDIEETGKAGA